MKDGHAEKDTGVKYEYYEDDSFGKTVDTIALQPELDIALDEGLGGLRAATSKAARAGTGHGSSSRAGRSKTWHDTQVDFARASYDPSIPTIRHVQPSKATSIPDFAAIRAAYHSKNSVNDPSNVSTSPHSSIRSSFKRPPTFWKDGGVNEVRESFRSVVTERSSGADLSITERSSVLTSNTSESESTSFRRGWPQIEEEEEISVDDVFSLYAGGFYDDPADEYTSETKRSMPSSPLALSESFTSDQRPHTAIAVTPTGRPTLLPSPYSDTAIATISTNVVQEDEATLYSARSMSNSPELRDRYGFKRSNQHIPLEQYDEWDVLYTEYLAIRRSKWHDLMKRNGLTVVKPIKFPPRSEKVKKYIRKGIPPEWRGAAWFWYADGPLKVAKYPGLYERLVTRSENGGIGDTDREHIERDLNRTFPDNIKFKPDGSSPPETSMIRALRRVLQAFAIYRPKIGYCQSLNFLAGLLLLFLDGDEEKAFFMLDIITSDYLPGTHGVALEGANIDIGVLMNSIKDTLPALWAKVDDRKNMGRKILTGDMRDGDALPTISLATTSWFMSCFVSTLPIETTLRVWDCLFYEGSKTLFRIALTIFKANERQLLVYNDPMEIFQQIQTLPKKMIDANELMDTCFKRKIGVGLLSQDKIDSRRAERRKMYARERNEKLTGDSQTDDSRLRRMTSRGRLKSTLGTRKAS